MLKEWMKSNNIDIDEEFKFETSDQIYRIHRVDYIISSDLAVQEKVKNNEWKHSRVSANKFECIKVIKLSWKPNLGDVYYAPKISAAKISYLEHIWNDTCTDNYLYSLGIVCKTSIDAEQKYHKIIEFCKKEFVGC